MTDIDRGAYAPQHDGPTMSFDPRRSRARQPAPFTLIFSGIVLAALISAVVMFYRGGVREDGAAPGVVGTPVVAMKGPASVDTSPAATEESLDVYVDSGPASTAVASAPAFAAPPEQPQPRPAPRPAPVAVAAVTPPAQPASNPVQVAAATTTTTPATTAAKPAQVVAAKPATTSAATPAAKPVQTAAATPAQTTPAAKPTTLAAATPPSATTPAPWGALPTARANAGASTTVAAPEAGPTVLAAVTKPALAAKPVATAAAETVAKPAAAPASDGRRYGVQIGAFSSASIADAEYAKVSGVVGGRGKTVTAVQKGGSTLYRTVVTGFGTKAEAEATCAKLKASGKSCFVKGV